MGRQGMVEALVFVTVVLSLSAVSRDSMMIYIPEGIQWRCLRLGRWGVGQTEGIYQDLWE